MTLGEVYPFVDGASPCGRAAKRAEMCIRDSVQSVRAGLDAVNAEYVAIHDAARPFVTPQVIWDALELSLIHI